MKLSEQIRALPYEAKGRTYEAHIWDDALEAAAQLAEHHEAGPLVIELDQGPPSELGLCAMQRPTDETYQLVKIRPWFSLGKTELWVEWVDGRGCCPLSGFPQARWSRLFQIGGGE